MITGDNSEFRIYQKCRLVTLLFKDNSFIYIKYKQYKCIFLLI